MCGYLTVYVCLCSVHRVIRLPSEQQNDSSTQNSPTSGGSGGIGIVANRPDSGGTVPTIFLLSRSCPDKTSQNLH